MQSDLIKVTQLPVIEQQLKTLKADVDAMVADALSLACTPETVQAVKAKRAELGKQFQILEQQRKDVKQAVLGPYEAFEAVYKDCVGDAFKKADRALKSKIDAVEDSIKEACEVKLIEYFDELVAAHHLEWLQYTDAGIKVGMTDARQKTPKKLMQRLDEFVETVEHDVSTLSAMEYPDEMLVEYKATLDISRTIADVMGRHKALEAARQMREQAAAAREREQAAVAKVEAVAPPVAVPAAHTEQPATQTFVSTFTVHGTRSQLIGLVQYMKAEGIQFENAKQ